RNGLLDGHRELSGGGAPRSRLGAGQVGQREQRAPHDPVPGSATSPPRTWDGLEDLAAAQELDDDLPQGCHIITGRGVARVWTEAAEADLPLATEEDVTGAEVTVHDPATMQVCEHGGRRGRHRRDQLWRGEVQEA